MNNFLTRYLVLFSALIFTTACTADNQSEDISISKGKHSDYYHLSYALTQDSFVFSKDEDGNSYSNYTADDLTRNGGQFELLIPVSKFPIPAPACKSHIIVRMPWTNIASANMPMGIGGKIDLFNSLKLLKNTPSTSLNVIIEPNPYVEVMSKSPLKLQLTGCNVFFRHANGQYINHTDELTN